jgi:CheY-like chemotaxis protein
MARILYIEDDKYIREVTVKLLKRAGHNVIPRIDTDGSTALADIWKPDLIITDHELGENKEKGLTAALRLKEDGFKVAVLSSSPDAFTGAREAKIPFFFKPYNISALLAEMEV